jgi:MFS family permease
LATGLVNILFFYPVGKIVDKIPPKIIMPISFLMVGLICCAFTFINNPSDFLSYLVWCLLSLFSLFQGVSLEGYFSKNIPKKVRGVMTGFLAFMGLIGRAICFKLGGYLFTFEKYWPFVMIGFFNFTLVILLVIVILCKIFEKADDVEFEFQKHHNEDT